MFDIVYLPVDIQCMLSKQTDIDMDQCYNIDNKYKDQT